MRKPDYEQGKTRRWYFGHGIDVSNTRGIGQTISLPNTRYVGLELAKDILRLLSQAIALAEELEKEG
jgi:hypothetical protein